MELSLGALLVLLAVGGAAAFVLPSASASETDAAVRDAQRIRDAVVDWRSDNQRGCPTLSQLKHEHRLGANVTTDDPWGQRYRVECQDGDVTVVSSGRDGTPGTADDVRVPKSRS